MIVGPSLKHRENGKVNPLEQLLFAEYDARARSSQAFMRRRRHNIAKFEWIVHLLCSDKATDMSNVSHQVGSYAVSDLTIASVVKISRIATGTAEKNIWLELCHSRLKRVHVDDTRFFVHKVGLAHEVVA